MHPRPRWSREAARMHVRRKLRTLANSATWWSVEAENYRVGADDDHGDPDPKRRRRWHMVVEAASSRPRLERWRSRTTPVRSRGPRRSDRCSCRRSSCSPRCARSPPAAGLPPRSWEASHRWRRSRSPSWRPWLRGCRIGTRQRSGRSPNRSPSLLPDEHPCPEVHGLPGPAR